MHKGHRLSAAKAFLHPHKRRRNLHILTAAHATKVLIAQQNKRAYGIEYIRNGKTFRARCRREVILSAGPLESPKLLMLSGVGPKEHLEYFNIPVLMNLRVGRTLYDHISFPGVIFHLNTTNASLSENKIATVSNLVQWTQYGDGLFTTPSLIEALGYIKTSFSEDAEYIPDIELIDLGGSIASDSGAMSKGMSINQYHYDRYFGSLNGKDTWSIIPSLLHPKSKGYLELRDIHPFSNPKIHNNYLTNPKDVAALIEGIKYGIKLGQSKPFQKYNPQLHYPVYPDCKDITPGSDEYWECTLRTFTVSQNHQTGTCKMGPPSDTDAVVDPELRVYGIGGLRVVDSSIIPRTISSYSTALGVMIGEKAADLIKNTWSNIV